MTDKAEEEVNVSKPKAGLRIPSIRIMIIPTANRMMLLLNQALK